MLRARVNPFLNSAVYSLFLAVLAASLIALPALAKPATPAAAAPPAFLPPEFAGWTMTAPARESDTPEAADAANGSVLKEYGFQQFESAVYSNGNNTLSIRAIRFQDATGAYGAYSFFRRPGSVREQIGRGAAWDGSHVLFWAGGSVVDATFGHLTAMSPAELRELADDLPRPAGSAINPPTLPAYLPQEGLEVGLTRYALGPDAYTRGGGVLPPALVDFAGSSAEIITATYSIGGGAGQLTLIEYPTPQLAALHLRDINAWLKAGNTAQAAWPQPLAESNPDSLLTRRSGPIIALTSGSFSAAVARKLLKRINYEADITWNKPEGYVSDSSKLAILLLNIFAFVGIVGGAAVLLGIFLGGGRALVRRLRGKPASAIDEETEFIRLNLDS